MSATLDPLPLMTSQEVAATLKLSRAQVARLAREGQIPSVRISAAARYRFRRKDIERLIGGAEDGP